MLTLLKKRPALRIESEDDIHGYIYAEDGTYHSEFDKRDYGIISDSLMPGNYKVVMCKGSNQLMHQNHVSDFEKFGLLENEDYILKELVITEDTTEDVIWNDINFDILVDDQHALIESECSYTASVMDAEYGYTNLDIRYAIDSEKWDASAESVKVMATLPDGVSYIDGSAYLVSGNGSKNEKCDVTIDDNVLTFTVDKDCLKGRIHFSVTTTEDAEGISTAYIKGKTTDFIGSVQFVNKQLTINNASAQISEDGRFWIVGQATAGNKVELFLGDAKLGEAPVNSNGKWSANLTIPEAVVGEIYLITACLSGDFTDTNPPRVEIECVENPIEVTQIDYKYF